MTINQRDKQRLRNAAQSVCNQLQSQDGAERIIWRPSLSRVPTWTDGWLVIFGSLGRNQPRLELWLDRWPNRSSRDFYFGFYSPQRQVIRRLLDRLPRDLSPVCELTTADYGQTRPGVYCLHDPLKRGQFNRPIYEQYRGIYFYYGMYHSNPSATVRGDRVAARRASAFFLDVLRCLPGKPKQRKDFGVYPRSENRQAVVRHLNRERDSLLAEDCKIRDNYTCQVCGFHFEKLYGELGCEFAEAHHIIPLSQLRGEVMSTVRQR